MYTRDSETKKLYSIISPGLVMSERGAARSSRSKCRKRNATVNNMYVYNILIDFCISIIIFNCEPGHVLFSSKLIRARTQRVWNCLLPFSVNVLHFVQYSRRISVYGRRPTPFRNRPEQMG